MFTDTRGLRSQDVLFWGRWMMALIVPIMAWALHAPFYSPFTLAEIACLVTAFSTSHLVKQDLRTENWWFGLVAVDIALVTFLMVMIPQVRPDGWSLYVWCVVEAALGLRSKIGFLVAACIDLISLVTVVPWAVRPDSVIEWLEQILIFNLETLPILFVAYWETRRRRELQDQLAQVHLHTARVKELEHINRQMTDYTMDVQNLAVMDQLTGLFNQTYAHHRLLIEVEKARQVCGMMGLVLFDIDHFKSFNDHFGHYLGDDVLRTMGHIVQETTQASPWLAGRIGGEEFVVLLPEASLHEAADIADSIRRSIAATVFTGPAGPLRVTISAGVAHFPNTSNDATELIKHADRAMYRAKANGRNRVCSYAETSGQASTPVVQA